MPFQKDNKLSVGIKNGRKTRAEEVAKTISEMKEKITNEALLDLARGRVYQQIEIKTRENAKDFALPIALKGFQDKDIDPKGFVININLDTEVTDKYKNAINAQPKDSSEKPKEI
jgi:hypothetical protein